MATEYDLLRLVLSRQEKQNQRTATTIDKDINITNTTINTRINITRLLPLLRTRPSWLRVCCFLEDHWRATERLWRGSARPASKN